MKKLVIAFVILAIIAVMVSIRPETVSRKEIKPFDALSIAEAASTGDYQYVYTQEKDTLDVTGTAVVSADPDKVDVYLGVETENPSALQSQQENAQIMQNIRSALALKGVSANSIETTSYTIYPVREYIDKKYVLTGYRTTHMIKVKLTDINKAGEIIDAAANAGANKVNNIQFGLSDPKQKQLRLEALQKAAQNAIDKANTISSALGFSLVKVTHVSEGYVSVIPYPRYEYAEAAPAAETEISPGEVKVSAILSVIYEII